MGMDWGLVVTILIFVECLIIMRGLVELSRQIEDGLAELDTTMAGAITSVIEKFGVGEGYEPPNPIQAAIGQIIQSRLSDTMQRGPGGIVEVMSRDASGQFEAKKES